MQNVKMPEYHNLAITEETYNTLSYTTKGLRKTIIYNSCVWGDDTKEPLTEMLFVEHLQSQLYSCTSQTTFLDMATVSNKRDGLISKCKIQRHRKVSLKDM
jgi:hypothetical protein